MTTAPPRHTRPVRVFSLRLWLPLSLVLASGVMFLIVLVAQQQHYQRELQQFADTTAHAELLETRRALETVLRRGDGTGTDSVVSQLAWTRPSPMRHLSGPMAM